MDIDSPSRRRLPPLLRRAWYGLNQAFRRRIVHLGITPDQFTVLRTLLETPLPGLTQRELAEQMSSDPNTITSLLYRMEKAGFLVRIPHESDRRAHRIQLLPQGESIYQEARRLAQDLQLQALKALPEETRESFLEQLAAVADACRLAADESPKRFP